MKVKIYGYGWVGKAMRTLFPAALVHDPGAGFLALSDADVAFVCVPTPLKDGDLDCSLVQEVVCHAPEKLIVIRSTVTPGFCDRLSLAHHIPGGTIQNGHRIVYQPEYLGETVAHPLFDQHAREFMILGGEPEDRRQVIELYQQVYNANIRITQVTLREAEVIKLSENRAIAAKVAFCQELYDACIADGTDYNTVREAVYGEDPRFTLWFTFVYPERRGFQSKCLPKDVYGWLRWAESAGIDPKLTRTMLEINEGYIAG